MEFIIYENFSDFKENFRDHFAGYEKPYIFFLKDYKNRYDEACQEYDEVIECATVTSNYNAALETQEERDDRERGIYEDLIPKLQFDINKKLVRALVENLKIPYSNDAPLPRIEDYGEIIHKYFCTLEAVEEFLEDKIKEEDVNIRAKIPHDAEMIRSINETFLKQAGWKSYKGFRIFQIFVDQFKNQRENHLINFSYLYWRLIHDELINKDLMPRKRFRELLYIEDETVILDKIKEKNESTGNNKETQTRDIAFDIISQSIKNVDILSQSI